MKRSSLADKYCPIARSSAELVDGWTFVILRELFLGNRRFDGLQAQTGMSPRSLTLRLKILVEGEILDKSLYQEKPKRYEYKLTEKGLDLWPTLIVFRQWGNKWQGPWEDGQIPMNLTHKGHNHDLEIALICKTCGEVVDASAGTAHISQHMADERKQMAAQHFSKIKEKKSTSPAKSAKDYT